MTSDTWAELPPVISWGRECDELGLCNKEQEPKNGYKRAKNKFQRKVNKEKEPKNGYKRAENKETRHQDGGGAGRGFSTIHALCLVYISLSVWLVLIVAALSMMLTGHQPRRKYKPAQMSSELESDIAMVRPQEMTGGSSPHVSLVI